MAFNAVATSWVRFFARKSADTAFGSMKLYTCTAFSNVSFGVSECYPWDSGREFGHLYRLSEVSQRRHASSLCLRACNTSPTTTTVTLSATLPRRSGRTALRGAILAPNNLPSVFCSPLLLQLTQHRPTFTAYLLNYQGYRMG